jgi:hypothetical protein
MDLKLLPPTTPSSYGRSIVVFGPSITSKMLIITIITRSVMATSRPPSTDTGFLMVGCWHTASLPATIISPSRICRERKFRGSSSVGLLDSNEAWITLFHEQCTNADVTIGSHLPDDCSTVILSSELLLLNITSRCLKLLSAFIELGLALPSSFRPRRPGITIV